MNYSLSGGIARIMLDDGKMNVMNWGFFEELNDCLDRTLSDNAQVLILTGRKGVFSAGLDLKLLPTLSHVEQLIFQRTFAETMLKVYLFPIPTIAAYEGHAIAGGAILSFACDRFIVLDGPYKIQINEVANKMAIPTWISIICRSSIPPRYWKEVLLHSRAFTPEEAYERGIVDNLVNKGNDVLAYAEKEAENLCKLDGPAYAATKRFMRREEAEHAMDIFDKELVEWMLADNTRRK
ncbi:MAG: enoyl-CoA hydratase-related protein [Syntrophales bacterium]|jgi:enoyl-CoA hydratase|nr:enoyl-CoA hydratase-related protein [Syntrophales bacterium]MDY0044919.1 enoyl-CoA hydratase-related protein [Syntrophales bacterium]